MILQPLDCSGLSKKCSSVVGETTEARVLDPLLGQVSPSTQIVCWGSQPKYFSLLKRTEICKQTE